MSEDDRLTPPDDLVALGHVTGAFGVKGWVKVQPYATDNAALLGAKVWWLAPSRTELAAAAVPPRAVHVSTARRHSATVIARLSGCEDREQAEAWRGQVVHVSRRTFPPTAAEEYYWVDLIGCTLWGEDDTGASVALGDVVNVSDNGAHAVLEVRPPEAEDRRGSMLVPFVAAHIQQVDLPGRRIISNWPVDF